MPCESQANAWIRQSKKKGGRPRKVSPLEVENSLQKCSEPFGSQGRVRPSLAGLIVCKRQDQGWSLRKPTQIRPVTAPAMWANPIANLDTFRAARHGAGHAVRPRPPRPLRNRSRTRASADRARTCAGRSPRAARSRRARDRCRRARLSQPAGHGRRLRQGCRSSRSIARPRLRIRRGRIDHPATAGRQSKAEAVSPGRGPRGDQPDGLQQWRRGSSARPARAPRRSAGDRGHQRRRQQGQRRSNRRLCRHDSRDGTARLLSRGEYLQPQHARIASLAGRRRAYRSARCRH